MYIREMIGGISLINTEQVPNSVKPFKNGNSLAFRISKNDREHLQMDTTTEFEKIVSPDGKEITFRKLEAARPNILEIANSLYDQHADLMKRLEKL